MEKKLSLPAQGEAIANSIGYVPEDRLSEGLFLTQSIGDNIIISEIDKLKKKNGQFDLKKRDEEIEKWIKELEIKTKIQTIRQQLFQEVTSSESYLQNGLHVIWMCSS